MKKYSTLMAALISVAAVCAQDTGRVTVPFSNPGAPKKLHVGLLYGKIHVVAHSGQDAVIETRDGDGQARRETPPREAGGLRRIDIGGLSFNAEQENNVLRVSGNVQRPSSLYIQVPADTSVVLRATNGSITVERLSGEIDVQSHNGSVTITDVTGAVVAHSLNGPMKVTMARVAPDKPMSFSSLNGSVDVTLPADTKARLKIKSMHGDVYTDFDFQSDAGNKPVVQESKSEKGKYRVNVERAFHATINGGGPEYTFTTLNGRINIRKGK